MEYRDLILDGYEGRPGEMENNVLICQVMERHDFSHARSWCCKCLNCGCTVGYYLAILNTNRKSLVDYCVYDIFEKIVKGKV